MEFQKVSVKSIWRDFTTLTDSERTMSSVEFILLKWNIGKSNFKRKTKFCFDDHEYIIRFFPKIPTKEYEFDDFFDIYKSYGDSVKYLFNVNEFVLITSKNRINEEKANALFSILAPILQQIEFNYPVFINIPLKSYLKYKGIMYKKSKIIHFNSFSCWGESNDYKGFLQICNLFNSVFPDMKELLYSGRKIIDIFQRNFQNNETEPVYIKNCFYCLVNEDPLYLIRFYLQWNRKLIKNYQPNFNNVNEIVVNVSYNSKCSHKTSFHSFLKHLQYMVKNNNLFKKWRTNNYRTNYYYEMKKIFNENKQIKSDLLFKSAPLDSIVLNLAIQIVLSKTEIGFANLWQCFLEKIRKNFDSKKLIPFVINDSPNYKYCLIYQKLQMINCCILKTSNFCLCEDDFNQLLDLYNISNDITIGTEIKTFFKAKHPNGTIEEFSSFIQKPVEEIKDLWENTKQNNRFDYETQAEIALDYLERLLPSEVFSQLILVLFDYILYDLNDKMVLNQKNSNDLYKEILNSILSLDANSTESYLDICRIIEKNTHKLTIIKSFDNKFKNKSVINELYEKGVFVYQQDEESSFLPNFLYNFENIVNSSKITEETIITSINTINNPDRNVHYLHIHSEFNDYEKPSQNDKSVISTIIEENI